MGIYEDLVWRGLIKDESSPEIRDLLNKGGLTFYIGTDPTGDSLHIGHFSSFLISKRLKDAGHNPILLVGGGTGLHPTPRANLLLPPSPRCASPSGGGSREAGGEGKASSGAHIDSAALRSE